MYHEHGDTPNCRVLAVAARWTGAVKVLDSSLYNFMEEYERSVT